MGNFHYLHNAKYRDYDELAERWGIKEATIKKAVEVWGLETKDGKIRDTRYNYSRVLMYCKGIANGLLSHRLGFAFVCDLKTQSRFNSYIKAAAVNILLEAGYNTAETGLLLGRDHTFAVYYRDKFNKDDFYYAVKPVVDKEIRKFFKNIGK